MTKAIARVVTPVVRADTDEVLIDDQAARLFDEQFVVVASRTDRMFGILFILQWMAGVVAALLVSPYAWTGSTRSLHPHVYMAVGIGFLLVSLPFALIALRPGRPSTRYVIAVAQMLWSGLLIHLSGGRIETHFHIFGSLAFLAFYRDAWVLVPATLVVAIDHFARQILSPESIYGVTNPEWWRFLEHAGWVLFIDVFIIANTWSSRRDMQRLAEHRARAELHQRQKLARVERLAEIGQLAASIGHELRNPLTAIRNAHTYIERRLSATPPVIDARVHQFMGLVERELNACSRIISNLLDFARARHSVVVPCALKALADEAIELVPKREGVAIENAIAELHPMLELDKEQFRQVFLNLIQNAVEAVPADRPGRVVIRSSGGSSQPFVIEIVDNGSGIPPDVIDRLCEPLYSTKTKGTGLGLAVVAGIVQRHRGALSITSDVGRGSTFAIELPADVATRSPVAVESVA